MPYGLYYPRSTTQAIYRFDNNLNDSSGNSKNMTCSGTAHYGQDHSRFGTHGIQMAGEYAYIAENFGWDMHKILSIVFWMKCTAASNTYASGGSEFIKVDDGVYNGGMGLTLTDDGYGALTAFAFLYKYDTLATAVYLSSALTIGSYGYWCLFYLRYTYTPYYYVDLFMFDPTGQTNSWADRTTYWLQGVNHASYTGSKTTTDYFRMGDIGAASAITVELDEVIIDSAEWSVATSGDEIQKYYTGIASGLRGPKAMV